MAHDLGPPLVSRDCWSVDVAIIGATGSCGRQVAAQLLDRRVLSDTGMLFLIGHSGGAHESELWGLRADLLDAFGDSAPQIEVGTDVGASSAQLVVMMAGATVTRDTTNRAALAESNRRIFDEAAADVGRLGDQVTVVVQSNPVELAIERFAKHIPRHRLIGAAAWSDSLRLRRELAAELGLRRPCVHAEVLGQHGDHLVPLWSKISARNVPAARLREVIARSRAGRKLEDLPAEVRSVRTETLRLVNDGDVEGAYRFVNGQPADLRAAVKPFFTHFTAGRTTELATAHAVVDIMEFILGGHRSVVPAQVMVEDEIPGLSGPIAVPVLLDQTGWSEVVVPEFAKDEFAALRQAAAAITEANR